MAARHGIRYDPLAACAALADSLAKDDGKGKLHIGTFSTTHRMQDLTACLPHHQLPPKPTDSVTCTPCPPSGMQVASRLWVVWGIIHPAQRETTGGRVPLGSLPLPAWLPPQVAQAAGVAPGGSLPLALSLATLLAAWSLTEVVRYGFFAIKVGRGGPWGVVGRGGRGVGNEGAGGDMGLSQ